MKALSQAITHIILSPKIHVFNNWKVLLLHVRLAREKNVKAFTKLGSIDSVIARQIRARSGVDNRNIFNDVFFYAVLLDRLENKQISLSNELCIVLTIAMWNYPDSGRYVVRVSCVGLESWHCSVHLFLQLVSSVVSLGTPTKVRVSQNLHSQLVLLTWNAQSPWDQGVHSGRTLSRFLPLVEHASAGQITPTSILPQTTQCFIPFVT